MRSLVRIENIEALRRQQGIDDVELREQIVGLVIGDVVRLTLLTGETGSSGETVSVRITRISGLAFKGKLTGRASCAELSGLPVGSPISFTAVNIHSVQEHHPTRK